MQGIIAAGFDILVIDHLFPSVAVAARVVEGLDEYMYEPGGIGPVERVNVVEGTSSGTT